MLRITNPATGKIIREIDEDTPESIRTKTARAHEAQPAWAERSLSERIACIRRFRELLVNETTDLAYTLTSEVGKPIRQSLNELRGTLPRIEFFTGNMARAIGPETVLTDPEQKLLERIAHEPLGVIANISAWNYPYFVGSNVFLPALLTGNAVLYKPSEFATLTGLEIARLLHEAGVPEAVFSTVIGGGAVGTELLKQNINGVFFTGSYQTGRRIAENVSGRLMKTQLELGGKDPIYVCEDVDIATSAAGVADGAFYNTGQSCCSVERIYVHHSIHDAFVEAFVTAVKGFKVGDPTSQETYIGPLTRPAQLETLENQVKDAVAKGAKLLCGGKRMSGPGNYFEPAVLTGVSHEMTLMREESFGPIIGIQKIQDDEEAVRLMNDSDYGLTAGVYTEDEGRAVQILSRVNAGSVYWNCCDRVSPRLPWSGRGHSGLGCTLSIYGIQAFTQLKAWHLKG